MDDKPLPPIPEGPRLGRPLQQIPDGLRNGLPGFMDSLRNPETTLNYSLRPGRALVSDDKGNELLINGKNTPAVTCNGKPQTVDGERLKEALAPLKSLTAPSEPKEPPRFTAPPNGIRSASIEEVNNDALSAIKNLTGGVKAASGSITYDGISPLQISCDIGKKLGVLQR